MWYGCCFMRIYTNLTLLQILHGLFYRVTAGIEYRKNFCYTTLKKHVSW